MIVILQLKLVTMIQEQRLTFDADNAQLGLGTGLGMNNFTVYSQVLSAGTNGIGIQAYGNN